MTPGSDEVVGRVPRRLVVELSRQGIIWSKSSVAASLGADAALDEVERHCPYHPQLRDSRVAIDSAVNAIDHTPT